MTHQFFKKAEASMPSNVTDNLYNRLKKDAHRIWDVKAKDGKIVVDRKIDETAMQHQAAEEFVKGDIITFNIGGRKIDASVSAVFGDRMLAIDRSNGDVHSDIPVAWAKKAAEPIVYQQKPGKENINTETGEMLDNPITPYDTLGEFTQQMRKPVYKQKVAPPKESDTDANVKDWSQEDKNKFDSMIMAYDNNDTGIIYCRMPDGAMAKVTRLPNGGFQYQVIVTKTQEIPMITENANTFYEIVKKVPNNVPLRWKPYVTQNKSINTDDSMNPNNHGFVQPE